MATSRQRAAGPHSSSSYRISDDARDSETPAGTAPAEVPCPACLAERCRPGEPCPRCGGTLLPAESGLVDERYLIERRLGSGGMGVVYLARDVWLRRPLALKLVTPTDDANTDRAAQALRGEAERLASVQSPHVVQVYAFGAHGRRSYVAMEYVAGESLAAITREHRARGVQPPWRRMLSIIARIAEGLDAVHAAGLTHRDVKPSNIVIEVGSGRPVLVDFGLAGTGEAWDPAVVAGTPHYMAPELTGMTEAPIGPPADVYSLACTAFALLAGRPPFEGAGRLEIVLSHIGAPPPRLSALRPDLTALDAAFERALAKDPARRFATCGAFADALAAAATPHVLVVDDDPAFRRFATRAVQLVFYGHPVRISTAASGVEALGLAEQSPPDLVLLDLGLPGFDGLDVLTQLRRAPATRHARVVAVGERAGDADRPRAPIAGADELVEKPLELEDFITRVRAVADRAGLAVASG